MSSQTIFFNTNVLSSFDNVRKFLLGKQALEKIKPSSPSSTMPNWKFRWKVLLCHPFHSFIYLFARCLESLSHCLRAEKAERKCKALAERQIFILNPNSDPLVDKTYHVGMKLLCSAENKPAPGTEDISKHSDIPIYSINDPKVLKRLYQKNGKIQVRHNDGICEGMSNWFLYLYVATKPWFANPRKHLIAITKQFEKGAPREASLLQSIFVKKGKILNANIQREYAKLRYKDYLNDKAGAKKIVDGLLPGAYHVSIRSDPNISGHSVVLIKINKNLSFFFDPNYGLYEINGENLSGWLLPKFDRYLDTKKMATYAINFHCFALRDPSLLPVI